MKELWRKGVRLAERLASCVVGTEKYLWLEEIFFPLIR